MWLAKIKLMIPFKAIKEIAYMDAQTDNGSRVIPAAVNTNGVLSWLLLNSYPAFTDGGKNTWFQPFAHV